jgi:uncharacterized protein YdcH (DUF465 family)
MPQKTVSEMQTTLEQLRGEHAKLEMRLKELDRHLSLTPDEQLERANLKKAKLQLKDDILHWTQQQRLLA